MQLTQEQTKRINGFLEGIGIDYIDIRFEMVDHIATEIENKVEDTDAFFENKRFQTIFVKYILSKKDSLQKKYEKIVKRRFWFDFLSITKDSLLQLCKPINSFIIIFFLIISYYLVNYNIKTAQYFFMCCFIIDMLYFSYNSIRFQKKYQLIKIIKSYNYITMFFAYIVINTNNAFNFYSIKEITNLIILSIHITAIVATYVMHRSFLHKRTAMKTKYQYLIQ